MGLKAKLYQRLGKLEATAAQGEPEIRSWQLSMWTPNGCVPIGKPFVWRVPAKSQTKRGRAGRLDVSRT